MAKATILPIVEPVSTETARVFSERQTKLLHVASIKLSERLALLTQKDVTANLPKMTITVGDTSLTLTFDRAGKALYLKGATRERLLLGHVGTNTRTVDGHVFAAARITSRLPRLSGHKTRSAQPS